MQIYYSSSHKRLNCLQLRGLYGLVKLRLYLLSNNLFKNKLNVKNESFRLCGHYFTKIKRTSEKCSTHVNTNVFSRRQRQEPNPSSFLAETQPAKLHRQTSSNVLGGKWWLQILRRLERSRKVSNSPEENVRIILFPTNYSVMLL